MLTQSGWFEGAEGKIHYRWWEPLGRPQRIVQIVHGYAEHGGRYGHVAAALAAKGAAVYADDHIGHGRSDGERALITNFDHVVDDLHYLSVIARGEYPGIPLVLVGHSMGGLLAGLTAERWPDEISGIAFCGSVLGDWEWLRDVLQQPQLPEVPFDPMSLSRDPAVGAAYAADPLVYHGQYKRGLLAAEAEALNNFQDNIAKLVMPVLFLHGTEDPFVPFQRSLEAVEEMPAADKTIHTLEGARHEVLNEINRDQVIRYLTDWVDRVTASG
jgi:alpha-beta hydrolase superfamily lysophospholipase